MIPFNFIYYRPSSLKEATDIFSTLQAQGKTAVYYAGGSETISLCRIGSIQPQAVIDMKAIPECNLLSLDSQKLHIGCACTLNQISESNLFPLLRLACGRIADHTNQCRITLGGNLCGSIIYRETSLPLLLADAEITLYSTEGERTVPFEHIFHGQIQKKAGELMVQVHIPVWALSARHAHIKKTAHEKMDYPLVSIAAIEQENTLRIAFSGLCAYPFRSKAIEQALNARENTVAERVKTVTALLPEAVHADAEASQAYRLFVFENTLRQFLEEWEDDTI